MRRLLSPLLAIFLGATSVHAADVTVVVDMTSEGRKVAHPSADHPAYYMPVMRGHADYGVTEAGDPPVSPHDVVHLVATELAKQGYRVYNAAHSTPDIILDIAWGSINLDEEPPPELQAKMYALVLGHTYLDVMPLETSNRDAYLSAADDNRYFVVVTAYDYAAFAANKKRVLLWMAKMSIPRGGNRFTEVLAPLIRAGGPSFGHESQTHPTILPAVPDGKVILGTPTVRHDADPSPLQIPQ